VAGLLLLPPPPQAAKHIDRITVLMIFRCIGINLTPCMALTTSSVAEADDQAQSVAGKGLVNPD